MGVGTLRLCVHWMQALVEKLTLSSSADRKPRFEKSVEMEQQGNAMERDACTAEATHTLCLLLPFDS